MVKHNMSSGGTSQNTNTQVQEIPAFEQQSSLNNQALAASLGAQPYPTYQSDLIQGMNSLQYQGENAAVTAANAYQPALGAATDATQSALASNPLGAVGPAVGTAESLLQTAPGAAAGGVGAGAEPEMPSQVACES